MPAPSSFNDYGPITWFQRIPVYVTTIIAALLVAGMFATTILMSASVDFREFAFWAPRFLRGALWQFFTYPFLAQPDFFFLFGVLFFYFAGIEVEKYLGRRRYLTLLGLLWLMPAVVGSAWVAFAIPPQYAGAYDITAGLFIAFATLYPNIEYFGAIPLKWIAFACLFLSSLSHLPRHDWAGLTVLWSSCAASFGYLNLIRRDVDIPEFFQNIFRRKPKLRVMPSPARNIRTKASGSEEVVAEIDSLLDKIAKHGLSSLTPGERQRLERASEALKKK